MTYYDMLQSCINFQSEVRFSVYDYDNDTLINLTEEDAKHREIKYIYPMGCDALMIEVEDDEE